MGAGGGETSAPDFKGLECGEGKEDAGRDHSPGWVYPSGWVAPYRAIVLPDRVWLAAGSPSCIKNTLTTFFLPGALIEDQL